MLVQGDAEKTARCQWKMLELESGMHGLDDLRPPQMCVSALERAVRRIQAQRLEVELHVAWVDGVSATAMRLVIW